LSTHVQKQDVAMTGRKLRNTTGPPRVPPGELRCTVKRHRRQTTTTDDDRHQQPLLV